MSVREYVTLSGIPEHSVRQELAENRIPHQRVGKRGLIRILRPPALAALSGQETQRMRENAPLRTACAMLTPETLRAAAPVPFSDHRASARQIRVEDRRVLGRNSRWRLRS